MVKKIQEKSVGTVIFHKSNQKESPKYLILHYPPRHPNPKRRRGQKTSKYGHWDFVKGHIEEGESQTDTLLRETEEESGLQKEDLAFVNGFKEPLNYKFRSSRGLHLKTVVFYLLESKSTDVTLSHEHDNFKWLPYEKALKEITFKGGKEILKKAHDFLRNSDELSKESL